MPPSDPFNLTLLRRWAVLLDSAFRLPGTPIRFGLDAIVGLVPGIGDLAAPAFTAMLLVTGFRMRLPAVVQARMVLNTAIDVGMGIVPLLGDLADVAWKSNLRNLALLERHAVPGVAPTRADRLFVFGCLGLVALVMLAPIAFVVWLLSRFPLV